MEQMTGRPRAAISASHGHKQLLMRLLVLLGLCIGMAAPVMAQTAPTPVLSPPTLPDAVAGTPYNQTITASGTTGPYSFTVTAGALPAGLGLDTSGLLSGTPTVAGSFNFTITATDLGGFSGDRAYTLLVNPPTITLAPASLPDGQAGTAYSQTITASGGTAPYGFAVTAGALPAGLSLNAAGDLAGTPSAAGSFNFTATATDANGFTGTRNYTLLVSAPTIALAPATLPDGQAGTAYSQAITASGGTAPYSFAVTAGTLPAGLSLNTAGDLVGTPTAAGSFNFTATATDANGFTGTRNYTLLVSAPTIVLAPATLPDGQAGAAYSQAITASGGTAPYSFAVTAGALPAGLSLNTTGDLVGTPTAAGSFNFTVTATDAGGFTGARSYTLQVAAPPVIISLNPATLPDGQVGTPYSQTLTASGGVAPYSFVVTGGALPDGLSLASDGALTGTPTAAGSFSFSITANDSGGLLLSNGGPAPAAISYAVGTFNYTIAISARPDPTTDPDVNGLLSAQAATTRNFATAQILNVHNRLERLHVAPEADWGFWFAGSIRSGDRDPHGNAGSLSFETYGVSGGIDYNFSENLAIGFGGGYGRDRTGVGQFGSRSDAHAPSALSYMSWHPDLPFFIDGLVAYQKLSFDMRRAPPGGGTTPLLAQRDGKQRFTSWSSGYEYKGDTFLVSAYARLDAADADLDDYSEQGDPIHALHYGDQEVESRTSTLGIRYESTKDTDWGEWERRLRLEFQRDFHDENGVAINYADTPSGPVFFTAPAGLDNNRIVLELGSLLETNWGINLRVDYRGVFGGYNEREHWLRFSFDED